MHVIPAEESTNHLSEEEKLVKNYIQRILDVIIMVLFSAMLILYTDGMDNKLADTSKKEQTTKKTTVTSETIENPIDFDKLQKECADIYAWITIPNTNVDYPIVQSPEGAEEDYYLHRDTTGAYSFAGTIYTQKLNTTTFQDPVTVIYGHSMLNKTMFGSLHSFSDPTFFDENQYFNIYTKGHILKYEIFAAHRFDNRLILAAFDVANEDVFQQYIDQMTNPAMFGGNHRDVEVTTKDKIVVLSTCINEDRSERYLIQAKLVEDKE